MDRQTLRDWVTRYNEPGLAGLSDHPKRGGAAPELSVAEKAVLTERVQQGPILRKMALCAGGYAICGTGSWHASSWRRMDAVSGGS